MTLYCISLFLEKAKISKLIKFSMENGLSCKELQITDQTGESGKGNQIDAGGIKILLLPCNDFHKDGDFEIGLTTKNKENWTRFVKRAGKAFKIEKGKLDDEGTEYLLMESDEENHGNFFFIFDGQLSDANSLSKISCTVKNQDSIFFKEKISQFLDADLLEKIEITSGELFSLNELRTKKEGKEIIFPIMQI